MFKLKLDSINETEFIRGSIIQRYVKCCDKKCQCRKGEKIHGPNTYLVCTDNKKTKHIYIPKQLVKKANKYVENYNKIWEGLKQQSVTNLQILLGSEK